ncbi:MAG: tetratricopeptide repeat protein [Anaerolineales bacterium]|jgi:putative thioredoxin
MMSSDYIIEVDEANFQSDVITYSNTVPVVVEFWAEWSQSCQILTPILERLAKEANGSFRLAKVNSDDTPNLNVQLGIHTLPTVKVFHKERLVNEFTGLQTEGFVREFLKNLVPAAGSLELERAHGLLEMKKYKKAAKSFRNALKTDPDNSAALLGLAKSLLAQGDASGSLAVLMDFPAGKQFAASQQIIPLAQLVSKLETSPQAFSEDELGIIFRRALTLVQMGNLPGAADGLLEVLRRDKNYRGGEGRQAMVGVLAMMDENNPETREYRNELASILF